MFTACGTLCTCQPELCLLYCPQLPAEIGVKHEAQKLKSLQLNFGTVNLSPTDNMW